MPIDYHIDPARRLICTRAWGVLTDADILSLKTKLLGDPAFDPAMPELSDITKIERLDVTAGPASDSPSWCPPTTPSAWPGCIN